MARKRHTPEQVVNLLRQVEVGIANGKTTVLACKEASITEQTYYRWRREYGGLQVDQAKRLKELEQENAKLKRVVRAGWKVGKDRVERIWRLEGLKVPQKQKQRGGLWFNDSSCVRLRPTHANHVWSYGIVSVRTHDERMTRVLNLIDEHTREALVVRVERRR